MTTLKENSPNKQELQKCRVVFRQLEQACASLPLRSRPFLSTEQMQGEDRER